MNRTKHIHVLPIENSSASVRSHGTTLSILSTATPFCVFHDDDNNTVVSFKVEHRPVHEDERQSSTQRLSGLHDIPESSNEICYPTNVEDIANRNAQAPLAATNRHGPVGESWNSNCNEIYYDDSITSAVTILNRSLQRPHQEIVLVRSKYSYAQESASRLKDCTTSPFRTISSAKSAADSNYGFPWDAYKEAISSSATAKSVKKTKSSSRYLPHYFDRATYAMVEL